LSPKCQLIHDDRCDISCDRRQQAHHVHSVALKSIKNMMMDLQSFFFPLIFASITGLQFGRVAALRVQAASVSL